MTSKTHRQPLRITVAAKEAAKAKAKPTRNADVDALIAGIARAQLFIDDVHAVHGIDRLDFTSVGHASLADALRAAFEAGRSAGIAEAAAKIGR